MNRSKDVMLRLFSVTFTQQEMQWWKNTTYLQKVFHAAETVGFWNEFKYYGADDDRELKKIESLNTLLAETVSWTVNSYILTSSEEKTGYLLELGLRNRMLNLLLKVEVQVPSKQGEVILDKFVEFACQLHESFKEKALLGPTFHVTLAKNVYPRPRPPRKDPQWSIGSLVDFISKPYHIHSGGSDTLKKLLTADLPDGVGRKSCGDLIVFRWVENLLNDEHIAARRSLQEQWFSQVLGWSIQSGYNELGDRLETLWTSQHHPPLTFYIDMYKYGYKAIVQNPDGSIDEELFDEMASWVKEGALPDGTPLRQLNLILPNRESALSVRPRAKAIRIKKVFYTDNEGNLWNPCPPGLWLEREDTTQ